jgi:hypothetical protein
LLVEHIRKGQNRQILRSRPIKLLNEFHFMRLCWKYHGMIISPQGVNVLLELRLAIVRIAPCNFCIWTKPKYLDHIVLELAGKLLVL